LRHPGHGTDNAPDAGYQQLQTKLNNDSRTAQVVRYETDISKTGNKV